MKKIMFYVFAAIVVVSISSCSKTYDDLYPAQVADGTMVPKINISGNVSAGDSVLVGTTLTASGAQSTGPIKSFQIAWGDGSSTAVTNNSSLAAIVGSHVYTVIGMYNISLKVFSEINGAGQTVSATKYVYVVNTLPLHANLSFSGANVVGDTALVSTSVSVNGTNSTGSIHSYNIGFGDGSSTGIVNVTGAAGISSPKTYNATGQYLVSLVVYDGANGTGNSSYSTKVLFVQNQLNYPSYDSLLIKYDSLYLGGNSWRNYWKLNLQKAFGINYTNDCRYRGDMNSWGSTTLTTISGGWVFFQTDGTQRFSITNMQGGVEVWAKLCQNTFQNDHSLTKWNSFGCVDIICRSNGTFPIYDPGTVGDQFINLSKPAYGQIRINVKISPETFTATPGVPPAIKLYYPGGAQVVNLVQNPSDPYGNYWYTDITPSNFSSTVKFQILPNSNNTTSYYAYQGTSFWGYNPSDQSFSFSSSIVVY